MDGIPLIWALFNVFDDTLKMGNFGELLLTIIQTLPQPQYSL